MLNEKILNALKTQNIEELNEVQQKVVPLMLQKKNVVVQSQTGSGKTLAYLLPIFEGMANDVPKNQSVIVLVPTKELAMQVHEQVKLLSQNSGIGVKSIPIFSDVNIKGQIERLKEKPQIIIGTPGRITELITKKKITAHTIKTLVIDEVDKLLEKGNISGARAVRKAIMRDTQVAMFSASVSPRSLELCSDFASDIEFVKMAEELEIPKEIKHLYFVCERRDKVENLRKLICAINPNKSLVFINELEEVEVATQKLQFHKQNAGCIHGIASNAERKKLMEDFKTGKVKHLLATDLAARGLHIQDIEVVFSMNIPEVQNDYLHRAGRVGRNGKVGTSVMIVTEGELVAIKKYEGKFGITLTQIKMKDGKVIELKK